MFLAFQAGLASFPGARGQGGEGLATGQWQAAYLQTMAYWMPRKRHMAKIIRKSCREGKKVIQGQVALH